MSLALATGGCTQGSMRSDKLDTTKAVFTQRMSSARPLATFAPCAESPLIVFTASPCLTQHIQHQVQVSQVRRTVDRRVCRP